MQNLSVQDLTVRIKLIETYIATQGNTVAQEFQYGLKSANKNFKSLALIDGYLQVLQNYNVLGATDPNTNKVFDSTDNCLTEIQIQSILEDISERTGLIFASLGTSYLTS